MTQHQQLARQKYRTDNVVGDGNVARISRCLPVPRVVLHASELDAMRAAATGKPCAAFGCHGDHKTELLNDTMPELGYGD